MDKHFHPTLYNRGNCLSMHGFKLIHVAKRAPGQCGCVFISYWKRYRHSVIVARLSKSLATPTLGSSKINQHCWRFHGSSVIAAPQTIGLISFCTGMHHAYFFRSLMCFRVPHLCSKIPKINNWTGEFATVIWRLACFTVSFRGDVRGESGPR